MDVREGAIMAEHLDVDGSDKQISLPSLRKSLFLEFKLQFCCLCDDDFIFLLL